MSRVTIFLKKHIKNIRGRTYLMLGGNNMQGVPASKIFSWPCRPRFGLKMVGDRAPGLSPRSATEINLFLPENPYCKLPSNFSLIIKCKISIILSHKVKRFIKSF